MYRIPAPVAGLYEKIKKNWVAYYFLEKFALFPREKIMYGLTGLSTKSK